MTDEQSLPVIYVDSALANNFGDHIELNVHLREYPELHDAMLRHEYSHTRKAFSKEDILLDLSPNKVNYWKLFKFMCIYPKTFLQFAPIYRKNKVWIYDINLSIVYGVLILAILFGVFVGFA
jgi:hypothetical protein